MQTQVLNPQAVGVPWLECHVPDGDAPERTWITSSPFWIGRSDLADLQVASTRVSRMHAKIVQAASRYRIQDSGSTNGTLLNGAPVKDAELKDGDILNIADIEFTFHCAASQQTITATLVAGEVTEAYSDNESAPESQRGVTELIGDVRRMQEIIAQGCLGNRHQLVVLLDNQTTFGYEPVGAHLWLSADSDGVEALARRSEIRLTQRMRALLRLLAVEEIVARNANHRVFVNLTHPELQRKNLLGEMTKLAELVTSTDHLVVQFPSSAPAALADFHDVYRALKQLSVGIAFYDFAAAESSVRKFAATPPDFLKLSPSIVRGIDKAEERQERVRTVSEACSDMGCNVIATDIRTAAEAAMCLTLGCNLGQGDHFQTGQPGLPLSNSTVSADMPAAACQ